MGRKYADAMQKDKTEDGLNAIFLYGTRRCVAELLSDLAPHNKLAVHSGMSQTQGATFLKVSASKLKDSRVLLNCWKQE